MGSFRSSSLFGSERDANVTQNAKHRKSVDWDLRRHIRSALPALLQTHRWGFSWNPNFIVLPNFFFSLLIEVF